MWWEVLVNFMQEKCEMLKRHWLLPLVELERFLFATPPVPLVHSMETEGWIPEFLQTSLQLCSEAMLWIWELSHLGDSEARRYILGSKARHVVSHFLLEDQFINLLVDEEDLVVSVLGEEEDHLDRFNLNLMCLCLQSSYLH